MKLSTDISFAMLANLLYLVTRLGLPPMILAYLSLAEYGLWAVCFMLIGYIGLADFGFSTTYVTSSAALHSDGKMTDAGTQGIGALLSTGILSMMLISSVLMIAVSLALPWLLQSLQIAPNLRAQASWVILACVAIFLFDMCFNAFAYVLHGLQEFRAEKKVWVATFMLELVLIAALLWAGLGILALVLAFGIRYCVAIACNSWQVFQLVPGLRIGVRQFSPALLPHFIKRGLKLQASSFFAMSLHSIDKLLAGVFLGPQAIALFDVASKLPVSAASIPAAISQATLPNAAKVVAAHDGLAGIPVALQALYLRTTRATAMLAALPLAFLALFAPLVCSAWLGEKVQHELALLPMLMALAAVTACVHISTGPGTAVFRAAGKLHNEFIYHFLRIGCLALALLLVLRSQQMQVLTLAYALCGAGVVAALLYLLHNHKQMALAWTSLVSDILLPACLPFVVAGLLRFFLPEHVLAMLQNSRLPALLALGLLGGTYLLICLVLYWQVLHSDEQHHLAARLVRVPGIGAFFMEKKGSTSPTLSSVSGAAQNKGGQHER